MSEQREGGTPRAWKRSSSPGNSGGRPRQRGLTDSRFEELAEAPQLEEVFLSEDFGRPQAVARRPIPSDPRSSSFPTTRWSPRCIRRGRPTRSETPGTGRSRRSAASPRLHWSWPASRPAAATPGARPCPHRVSVSARGRQQGGGASGRLSQAPPITSAAAPVATTAAQSGTTGGVPFTNSGGPTAVTASTVSPVVAAPPGTTVAASPAPTGGSPSSGGTAMAAVLPRRRRRRRPADPLAPVGGERRQHGVGAGHHRDEHGDSDRSAVAARGPGHGIVGKCRNGPEQHRPCAALAEVLTIPVSWPPNWCAGTGRRARISAAQTTVR